MDELTKTQKRILYGLYRLTQEKRKSEPDAEWIAFPDSNYVNEKLSLGLSRNEASSLCWDLQRKGFIICAPGDDLANEIQLTPDAIAFAESRPRRIAEAVLDIWDKLKPG